MKKKVYSNLILDVYEEDNGNIKRQGIWKNGKAIGLFKFFNSDGKIIKTEIWKNGKMVKRIFEINMGNISFITN